MSVKMIFADRLKKLRDEEGLSQEELGEALEISRGSVSYYEKGLRTPDIEILQRIANHFNVSADYLLGTHDKRSAEIDDIAIRNKTGLTDKAIWILKFCKKNSDKISVYAELIDIINTLIEEIYSEDKCSEVLDESYLYDNYLYTLKEYLDFDARGEDCDYRLISIENIDENDISGDTFTGKFSKIANKTLSLTRYGYEQMLLLQLQDSAKFLKENKPE